MLVQLAVLAQGVLAQTVVVVAQAVLARTVVVVVGVPKPAVGMLEGPRAVADMLVVLGTLVVAGRVMVPTERAGVGRPAAQSALAGPALPAQQHQVQGAGWIRSRHGSLSGLGVQRAGVQCAPRVGSWVRCRGTRDSSTRTSEWGTLRITAPTHSYTM